MAACRRPGLHSWLQATHRRALFYSQRWPSLPLCSRCCGSFLVYYTKKQSCCCAVAVAAAPCLLFPCLPLVVAPFARVIKTHSWVNLFVLTRTSACCLSLPSTTKLVVRHYWSCSPPTGLAPVATSGTTLSPTPRPYEPPLFKGARGLV